MAAAILEEFPAGTEVSLVEGRGGILDVVADDKVVFSKKDKKLDDVDEKAVCAAIREIEAT